MKAPAAGSHDFRRRRGDKILLDGKPVYVADVRLLGLFKAPMGHEGCGKPRAHRTRNAAAGLAQQPCNILGGEHPSINLQVVEQRGRAVSDKIGSIPHGADIERASVGAISAGNAFDQGFRADLIVEDSLHADQLALESRITQLQAREQTAAHALAALSAQPQARIDRLQARQLPD